METSKFEAARQRIKEWKRDPHKFVRDVFKAQPDVWQADVLNALVEPGRHRFRLAMKACAGPGKTAVLAWIGWWRLMCFASRNEHPKGAAVSITSENLADNLWAEMARWQNESPMLLDAFVWQKTRIYARHHPETWFLSAKGWSKSADLDAVGRTLSGLHSKYPFYLIDESGDIPPNMIRSAEQGLSTCEDGLIVTAGNPTSDKGLLYEVCTKLRTNNRGEEVWKVVSITADPDDPRRTPRVPKQLAQDAIDQYGRDNPWVMSYFLGQFPPGSIDSLLSVQEVENAMQRNPKPEIYEWAQKRLGIDVARFGDDRTVIFPRQGLYAMPPTTMRHKRDSPATTDIANRVMFMKNEWRSEMEFFDNTFQWAKGAIDVMRAAGHSPIAVEFDKPSPNPSFGNMRAQCWMKLADWVKEGGCLPESPGLIAELTAPTYFFTGGKFMLEPKDQIKKRLGRSPDEAEALALTFALPDMPGDLMARAGITVKRTKPIEYDPYARL
jgi:phage terminase large subunit